MTDYTEQYKQRAQLEQEMFDGALRDLAHSVNRGAAHFVSDGSNLVNELNMILKSMNHAPVDFSNAEDPIEYLSDRYNIESRGVVLKDTWYKDAFGSYLAELDDGSVVALILRRGRYRFIDPETKQWVTVNEKTAQRILPDALFFYKPLPSKAISTRDLFWNIFKSLSRWDVACLILATLGVTLIGMITPKVTQVVFSGIIPAQAFGLIGAIAVLLFGAALASSMISIVKQLLLQFVKINTSYALHAATMNRVMSLPASFFRNYSAGDLASRVNAAEQIANSSIDAVFSMGLTGIFSLLYIFQVMSFAPSLVIPALIVLGLQIVVSVAVSVMKSRRNKERMSKESKLSGVTLNIINNMQKIRLTGQESRIFASWANGYQDIADLKYCVPRILLWYSAINTFVATMGTVVFYLIAAQGNIAYADFLAFISSYGMLSAGISSLIAIVDTVANFEPMLNLLRPIMEAEPELEEGKEIPGEISGGITLSRVSFRYQENAPLIVDDFSIKIEPGQYVGICGSTGCGKSTLLRLMLGFETPESGEISYDNYALSAVNPRVLRRNFGTVLQNAQLMQGSLLQNITVGLDHATEEDAWAAAEAAGIADDIRAMPMKMETMVSYGGGGLSGGQKQRILIARALVGKPKVIFMDEATSALDNVAQAQVSKSMDALDCTRVVIAHRLSTIQNCDRILVLDKGRVVEDGTYEELIALDGRFAQLVAKQRLDI